MNSLLPGSSVPVKYSGDTFSSVPVSLDTGALDTGALIPLTGGDSPGQDSQPTASAYTLKETLNNGLVCRSSVPVFQCHVTQEHLPRGHVTREHALQQNTTVPPRVGVIRQCVQKLH